MTDGNTFAKNLLGTRGRRCVATILTYLEENVWEHVPPDKQQQARSAILATLGEYQDLAMDIVTSDTGTINQFWVEELENLHQEIRSLNGRIS